MLKSYKSSLNLNSYKIDTKNFQQKLKYYSVQQNQLKSTLTNFKLQQNAMLEQIKSLKIQNQSIKNRLKQQSDYYSGETNKCNQCKYLESSLNKVIKEIQAQKSKTRQFKQMYENQLKNKKQSVDFYDKKIKDFIRDKDILVRNYQQKLRANANKASYYNGNNISESVASLTNHFTPIRNYNEVNKAQNQSAGYILSKSQNPERNQSSNQLPPNPKKNKKIQIREEFNKNGNNILPLSHGKSFTNLLMPVYERLEKMQVSLEELKLLPQIQKFMEQQKPGLTKFIKVLRDFPFECQNQNQIEESYNFMEEKLNDSNIKMTGTSIMELIFKKINEIRISYSMF